DHQFFWGGYWMFLVVSILTLLFGAFSGDLRGAIIAQKDFEYQGSVALFDKPFNLSHNTILFLENTMSNQSQNPSSIPPDVCELLERARQYALDIERHARIESSQGHLSPTDLALFSRLVMFLRFDIAQVTTG